MKWRWISVAILLTLVCFAGCGPQRKLERLRRQSLGAQMVIADEKELPEIEMGAEPRRDTMVVEDLDGNQVLIMRAVKDENGEMVATDVLQAARVTARFRNVAERSGRVDLSFRIIVPEAMQDRDWQLRFYPDLFIREDSLRLDPILITGESYRKAQLKGYEHYQKFLDSIAADSTHFIDRFQLEMFLRRNLPDIYRYKTDSTSVSDEEFRSHYGITERQALTHYTNQLVVRRNRWKVGRKDQMFRKYVKVPIVTEGLRLDTVIVSPDGDILYDYVQSIHVTPSLRKATVLLSGDIFEEDRRIYRVPRTEPLTFYISSISGLSDDAVRYKTVVTERRVQANTACYIDFDQGRAEIRKEIGHNREEMARIEGNLRSLLQNRDFDMDSIVVTASCSPEGSYEHNRKLSMRRSESVSTYFDGFLRHYRDSVRRSGFHIGLDDTYQEEAPTEIKLLSRNNPENWTMLDALVREDEKLSEREKEEYERTAALREFDLREQRLQKLPSYRHIRENLYPRLRTVRFDFHLHRKGLQKDTIHTTVVDSVYMRGLQAIRDREYEQAVTLLRPYKDYNTAVAFCALDYNASALEVLEPMERTDRVLYLLAILYSRQGDDRKAVESYLKACRLNPTFIHRGNLDPEIAGLIRRYGLDRELQEDDNNLTFKP
ncbi:MAG: tetratricopeptide repeat protein [Bacteroidales bacterium]|nr:tetratricopeptide repeat protein [Bacteroidales bacterium]